MKVILVNGSPDRHGCTATALAEVAAALEREGIETEMFHIGGKPISGCLGCGRCNDSGRCFIDDCVNDFIDRAASADGFVFGSPVYFASANGAMTAFMDRVFYAAPREMFFMKPAAAVASARRAGTTVTLDQLNKYFMITQMPIVSSQYWNMVHGNTPDEVRQDLEGLQIMRTLGKNMAYMLHCLEAGRAAGVPLPAREARVATNFIH